MIGHRSGSDGQWGLADVLYMIGYAVLVWPLAKLAAAVRRLFR